MNTFRSLFVASALTGIVAGCASSGAAGSRGRAGEPAPIPWPAEFVEPEQNFWYANMSPEGETPLIEFNFAAPHDSYGGIVRYSTGSLHFGKGFSLDRSGGGFTVDVGAIDMGDDELTQNVQNAMEMLDARRFPKIRFKIESIQSQRDPIPYGVATPVVLHGRFSLKGVTLTKAIEATVEPKLTEAGDSVVLLAGSFNLTNLATKYDISGPGEPDEAEANTVEIRFRFPLVPRDRLISEPPTRPDSPQYSKPTHY